MKVEAVLGGLVKELTNSDLYLAEHDGLGPLPINRIERGGPLQHGATDLGWQGLVRRFMLAFDSSGSPSERYDERKRLARLFAPDNDLALRFTLPNGNERQVDCKRVESPLPASGEGYSGRFVYRFRAGDPTFYDPTLQVVEFALGGSGDTLEVPLEVAMVVGTSTLDATQSIDYSGDFESFPVLIRITGPITDCVITNEETDKVLDFTGVTIASGDYYDIDLRYSYKTVEDSSGTNKADDLTDDSDLAEWSLVPSVKGEATRANSIRVTGSAVDADTEVEIQYYIVDGGI
jgi:hypothetical protein